MMLTSLLKITNEVERPQTPDPVDDNDNDRLDNIVLQFIGDSIGTRTGTSDSRENAVTVTVVEMPNTTSTREASDGLECDNFANISVEQRFKGGSKKSTSPEETGKHT